MIIKRSRLVTEIRRSFVEESDQDLQETGVVSTYESSLKSVERSDSRYFFTYLFFYFGYHLFRQTKNDYSGGFPWNPISFNTKRTLFSQPWKLISIFRAECNTSTVGRRFLWRGNRKPHLNNVFFELIEPIYRLVLFFSY